MADRRRPWRCLPGSPAIDAGSNALIPSGVTTDQRGYARIVNGTVDIGAYEYLNPLVVTTASRRCRSRTTA